MNFAAHYTTIVDFATPAYANTIGLRHKILKKPLGIDFHMEDIRQEYRDIHLAYYNEHAALLACLVLVDLGGRRIKMRQVAVDTPFQRMGIGRRLVMASEIWAKHQGFLVMELNARESAQVFYDQLAYRKVGAPFIEVDLPHFKMEKRL
ncbi:MAG: GNAT family N-acetyltransferase [Bacteroidota bacterium]